MTLFVIGTLPSFHSTDVGNGISGGWEAGAASALCVARRADRKAKEVRTIMSLSRTARQSIAHTRTISQAIKHPQWPLRRLGSIANLRAR
jgi:hypothetical protein